MSVIDRREIEVDHRVIELIVRDRPMARDLRLVMTAIKIAPDLERVADHAVNIADQAIVAQPGAAAQAVHHDAAHGRRGDRHGPRRHRGVRPRRLRSRRAQVIASDDAVDAMHEQIFRELLTYMMEDPTTIPRALALLLVARSLERIADQGTNIAEQVVYLVEARGHPAPARRGARRGVSATDALLARGV